ncbi:MAG: 3-hydroxybutyryl-CoA dehydrogenase [Rhodospirillales bacterium]|jgi:3-hydroxybutyryl-CoA dehydrogenase|nr:3-hydroxybutyryl-CoA dehydrogenase [Rhodospirillales bacterium]MDG4604104.1 3-hydroxybutyryl-CoA dehydrogenase [Defluviicoccus sp.]MDG4608705.1 3-hydroxybutyryl-CoA dehydrogenase [Defluviicoccus sp.]HOT83121.1 3-hydroxybutyryl-CoA dehydrogenase [Candidatus Defluviicoccus seviourii]
MEIRKVGVVGAGTMGNGIAQVFAIAGYNVVMRDIKDEFIARGLATIRKSLERMASRAKITPEAKDAALGRIEATTEMNALADCDLVIEAALEDVSVKAQIFRELDAIVKPGAILATNTSSISVTKVAAATKRPDHVIGMHFFNPVPMMQLVEVIRALQTSDEVCRITEEVSRKVGKTPHTVKDSYGFVGNRVLIPMINEAINCLYEGLAGPEDIDSVMKLGMNHPMGPLALCDLIGLDITLNVMETLYQGFEDSKYRPSPLLKQMVDAGYLGRKTGRGFYTYDK